MPDRRAGLYEAARERSNNRVGCDRVYGNFPGVNDYDRIKSAIHYLNERHLAQPSLAEMATACNLSESHFHRLFQRWAGITPKDFLQCLTLEFAKEKLRQSESVLDAALDAGLSGAGRLHDLFVSIEAASPGEFKTRGRGLNIVWGMGESPFGGCSVGLSARGLCHLAFHDTEGSSEIPEPMRTSWANANFTRDDARAKQQLNAIFTRRPKSQEPLKLFVTGTLFQLKVWQALLRIPLGTVSSYGKVANRIACPNAARAVGAACGANPIAYLIPCHRVIRETGAIEGYRWGHVRKQALLGAEFASHLS